MSQDHLENQFLDDDLNDSITALAGPGATRQAKRLQLRKAGFRGKTVPNRNVTPGRAPSSAWSRQSSGEGSLYSDVRPLSSVQDDESAEPLPASGILQEISNSSHRRKKSGRVRAISIFEDENATNSPKSVPADAEAHSDLWEKW